MCAADHGRVREWRGGDEGVCGSGLAGGGCRRLWSLQMEGKVGGRRRHSREEDVIGVCGVMYKEGGRGCVALVAQVLGASYMDAV